MHKNPSNCSASVVLTTIADSDFLQIYRENFAQFGWLERASVFLIPDRKTPAAVREKANAMARQGMRVACPSIEEQEAFLAKLGLPPSFIPYDSDNRRNVGFLMALESGDDFLVSVDDDNFCRAGKDFMGEHAIVVADAAPHCVARSSTGYLNICALLDFDRSPSVYPRGFPYHARHKKEDVTKTLEVCDVHCNAGLWLLDPDVDAITWLVANPHVSSFKGDSLVLDKGTWSPVNSQNTALRRDAIPAYYFVRMGYSIDGVAIDRYGDIFSGYFIEACTKHLGGGVRFGSPIADHRRNAHQYLKDATREWACIVLLEDLLPWLTQATLDGGSYLETYECLSHLIEDGVESFRGSMWTDATRGYFHQMGYSMRLWNKACRTIMGS